MGAGASKPTQEEVAKRYKRCAAVASAHRHCVAASGSDAPSACAALETSLLGCLAKDAAPREFEVFTKCVNKAMSARGKGPTACAEETSAMRKAVAAAGLWPPPRP